MNVNNSDVGTGVDWRRLGKALLICVLLMGLGTSLTGSLSRELHEQAQLIGFIGGIVGTISYNLTMMLYVYNKPPLADDLERRRRAVISIMLINVCLVALIVFTQYFWPSLAERDTARGLFVFSTEHMTPGQIGTFQMLGIACYMAASYVVMTAMMGIQNILSPSYKWPATFDGTPK